MEEDYKLKYLEYKLKYLTLKNNQKGGLLLPQTYSRQVNANRAVVANIFTTQKSNPPSYEMQSNKPSNNLTHIEGKCDSQQYDDNNIKQNCSVSLNDAIINSLKPENNTSCSIDASRKANICLAAHANIPRPTSSNLLPPVRAPSPTRLSTNPILPPVSAPSPTRLSTNPILPPVSAPTPPLPQSLAPSQQPINTNLTPK